ncbi:tetratricopeptide repeat protein [candidate division KSB1 bacterium]|nr:tetratricopeptide repeat protein [candidate division KSB1 bacterium]
MKRASLLMGLGMVWVAIAFWGCAVQKPIVKKEISPERQRAIADSLARVRDLEIRKNRSIGYEYYKNKQYEEAKKYLWKVVRLDEAGKYTDIYSWLAYCYISTNQADSAQLVYERGVEKAPDDGDMHLRLADILYQKDEVDRAIEEFEKGVALIPDNPDNFRKLADLYLRNDEVDEAIQVYQRVVELAPEDKEAQETLSHLIKTSGDQAAYIQSLEQALIKFPDDIKTMMALGRAYFDANENQKAAQVFNRLLSSDPKNTQALEYLGNTYQNLGKYQKAITTQKKILGLEPKNARIMCDIASSYKSLKQYKTARSYARRAQRADPSLGLVYVTIGEILEACAEVCVEGKGGKMIYDDKLVYKMAIEEYEKAYKDLEWKDYARKRASGLKGFVPTSEDIFYRKGSGKPMDKALGKCYQWIYE